MHKSFIKLIPKTNRMFISVKSLFRNILLIQLFLSLAIVSSSQDKTDTTVQHEELEEVIISANKFAEKRKNIAQNITVINSRKISTSNVQNTGDLLMNSGNIFVQKSQQGGSSPVIRGFEASRVLIVVDGVRLNNAIFRSGHLQNIISVDQNMLERVEVLYGPASTLYGSDALGGVIHLKTKMPKFSEYGTSFTASGFARYSSANNEKTVHADMGIAGKKLASLTSFTTSDFDDMKMGSDYSSKYPDFGKRSFYVQRFGTLDSVVKNEDDRIQRFSGYTQWDLLQKFLYQPSDKYSHSLNLQMSSSGDIPRYDRLQDIRNGLPRYAAWYYGPQKRNLVAYEFNATKLNSFFQELRFTANYQFMQESRHQRNFRNNNLDNRIEKIHVVAASLDARRKWKLHEFNLGMDAQLNDVHSSAFRKNIVTDEISTLDSRYPDGSNNMNYAGVFAQHVWKIIPDKLILNDGVRFQYVDLRSTIIDNETQLNLPFNEISQDNIALTGNLGLVYLPDRQSKISLSLASGFRAPNIDDLAKIFESSTQAKQLIVPNPGLKPEYTYSIDLSLSRTFAGKHRIILNGYFTWLENAIGLAPFKYQEKDSFLYDGVLSAVLANQNHRNAYLYGTSITIHSKFSNAFSMEGMLNYTFGRYNATAHKIPMDHIPPVFGKLSMLYQKSRWQAEFYTLYNGWKRLKAYNPDGEDNLQYATAEGMPAWFTLNLKGQYTIIDHVTIQAGIENILDRNYRPFASGFSAAGRNYIIAIRAGL